MRGFKKFGLGVGIFFVLLLVRPTGFASAVETYSADPFYHEQWGLYNDGSKTGYYLGIDIGISEAWKKFKEGNREVIVAVIDTGVDIHHEDLQNALWVNPGEIPNNGIDDEGNGFIDDINGWNFYDNNNILYKDEYDKHSTHVTGVIAADRNQIGISGIVGSSKVKVMVLKVLGGKEESGYTYAIGDAIRYAENNGAVICNLSFGTKKSDRNLTDAITHSGMLFITAAGNGSAEGRGQDISYNPVYPASYNYENIISVANLLPSGYLNPASNYSGSMVELAAPGTRVLSTVDWGTYKKNLFQEPYGYMSGTSMAVPMVTGVAALLYAQYPELDIFDVKEALIRGNKPLASLTGLVSSGGMLNAAKAMEYAETVIIPRNIEREAKRQQELLEAAKKLEEEKKLEEAKKAEEAKFLLKKSKGSKPVILIKKDKKGKINLIFRDADKDIALVRYANGKQSLSYFKRGRRGQEIIPKKGVTKGLSLKKGKTYTIFAIDKKGNQTVKTIIIKK